MREVEFEHWLQLSTTLSSRPRADALSRCRRVDRFEGDLDTLFERDRLADLLDRLKYSTEDAKRGSQPRHNIPISGDVRNGSASLANAVRLYVAFRDGQSRGGPNHHPVPSATGRQADVVRAESYAVRSARSAWPEWQLPSNRDLLLLAQITAPYIRFLSPAVVERIIEDNENHRCEWARQLELLGINSGAYLWERGPCVFPGIRRYSGSTEIAQHRGRLEPDGPLSDALQLDDNHFPKQTWSYLIRGKPFQNMGPDGYSLAHLADHKQYKNRGEAEFELQRQDGVIPVLAGLHTSITNSAYLPVGLIRPTDFAVSLRNLLQRKAVDLYGSFCNLFPDYLTVRPASSGAWSLEAFEWANPVGTTEHVDAFLNYRALKMESLLAGRFLS